MERLKRSSTPLRMVIHVSALQDALRQRRSIRRFRDQPVPESLLLQVLDAGRWAPSAGNIQPWRMILVSDPKVRAELLEAMTDYLKEEALSTGATEEEAEETARAALEPLPRAPVLVVACMTKEIFGDRSERWLSEHAMGVQSVAAAVQNMLLAAHDVGLGGCWCSAPLLCPTAVRRVLGIPQGVEPQAIIALGYPDEEPEPPRRRPLSEAVYLNRWKNEYRVAG